MADRTPMDPNTRDTENPTRMPPWLRRTLPVHGRKAEVERLLDAGQLHTVCKEASCPNRGECFGRGTATFLIMGSMCTRDCAFCGVSAGRPQPLDPHEPRRIAEAALEMRLQHVVVTSVTRDDLPDGGAAHFAATVQEIRSTVPGATIEVLAPDFAGSAASLATVLSSLPDVLNHNVETVPRLYGTIRPQADYRRSLSVLRAAADTGSVPNVKSGLMVGFGETEDEVNAVLHDLCSAGVSMVTIGQYLRPSAVQTAVVEFVHPDRFERYREAGVRMGLRDVFAGPFVRSSYRAGEVLRTVTGAS